VRHHDVHSRSRRITLLPQRLTDPAEYVLPDPHPQMSQLPFGRVDGRVVVQVIAEIHEAFVLAAGGIQVDAMVLEELLPILEYPSPVRGIDVVRQLQA